MADQCGAADDESDDLGDEMTDAQMDGMNPEETPKSAPVKGKQASFFVVDIANSRTETQKPKVAPAPVYPPPPDDCSPVETSYNAMRKAQQKATRKQGRQRNFDKNISDRRDSSEIYDNEIMAKAKADQK
jgi:hypothetical protein